MGSRSVRIGIVGVGNCASSLVQGLTHYGATSGNAVPIGVMHEDVGGLGITDVQVASAFDVVDGKVGRDVAEAIVAQPNNTLQFAAVAPIGVCVSRGPTLDGVGRYVRDQMTESPHSVADVVQVLRDSGTEVLVNYLPVGSDQATHFYAECALEAGCALVNCIPVFIASDPVWARRFEQRGLPIIGDDVKSQLGATILHRSLVDLFAARGIRLDRTSQLNVGGNSDFRNMLERERLASKKISKTQAVTTRMGERLEADNVHVGPSDFVPWLADRKWAYIRMEGTGFGGAPLNIEVKLEVWDSPNSAGIVVDAVRCAKLAIERKLSGALTTPSSAYMKSPPEPLADWDAHARLVQFMRADTERRPA